MLKKLVCKPKIHSNQSINYLSTEKKKYGLNEKKNQNALID